METNNNNTFPAQSFQFAYGEHNNKEVIWIQFPYDTNKIKILKQFTKPRWSQSKKSWYVPDTSTYRTLFQLPTKSLGKTAYTKIAAHNWPQLQEMHNLLTLKGYSKNTIKTYCVEFAQLLYTIQEIPVQNLNPEKIKSYLLYCHHHQKLSDNQMHSRINAIKFYYQQVLHQHNFFIDIPRPKKPSLLPKALNTQEIKKIIDHAPNLKHRLIIKLCYGMGLRVSEIVNLKIQDIDSTTMRVHIAQAKGKKDRFVNLPYTILEELRLYYKEYKPQNYLFEGQNNQQYAIRSAQQVFKNAMIKAKINKKIGIHSLRHSFATHLLEAGTDISHIQKLLGHHNIKTTLIYTQVTDATLNNIKSPLDNL